MITQINYNWFHGEYGEEFSSFSIGQKVGDDEVIYITQNQNPGKENQWEVYFKSGKIHYIYNVNQCFWEPDKTEGYV